MEPVDANMGATCVDYSQRLVNRGEDRPAIAFAQKGKLVDPQDAYASYSLAQAFTIRAGFVMAEFCTCVHAIRMNFSATSVSARTGSRLRFNRLHECGLCLRSSALWARWKFDGAMFRREDHSIKG